MIKLSLTQCKQKHNQIWQNIWNVVKVKALYKHASGMCNIKGLI